MTFFLCRGAARRLLPGQDAGSVRGRGLDVALRMRGPQVNGMQLLLAGEADVYTGYDFQVLSGVEKGLPVRAVAATFQHDLNGILTHEDVAGLDDWSSCPIRSRRRCSCRPASR
ncbi:ABC transporter substrate-binding protein [Mameliella sp. LZ-28]|uniref:ABC transporter substrate-binding protein n=1 Tax=Mameliella TaxID=1434019 RepID=UPI0018E334CE|nr:ABC transporter substrate-binding protein [Mameliella sp. LZ-28]